MRWIYVGNRWNRTVRSCWTASSGHNPSASRLSPRYGGKWSSRRFSSRFNLKNVIFLSVTMFVFSFESSHWLYGGINWLQTLWPLSFNIWKLKHICNYCICFSCYFNIHLSFLNGIYRVASRKKADEQNKTDGKQHKKCWIIELSADIKKII